MELRSAFARKKETMRILVADDDAVSRRFLLETLERGAYDVTAAENGRIAFECLSRKGGPRLAVLDWLMPDLDGLQVCREIRRHSEYPYIYIILLNSRKSKEDVASALQAGADDCLTKPFDPEELKARLRSGERILKLEDRLTHDAFHDSLTHLPNRAFLLERLTLCVGWRIKHPDYKFAILSVDVDRFKIVNDSLGNIASDRLLVQIADRLLAALRRDDGAVSSSEALRTTALRDERSILARLGGDKFTILLDHIRNASEGIRVAERVQQSIQAPFVIDNQDVFITASIGIAFSGTGYSEAEDMLGDANTAMTRAKTLGKARYEMCDPSMHSAAAGRLRLETDLRRATERGEFRVHYQPVVSLRDFCVTGFEALVRWQRPGFGLVTPEEFISVAEDTGLILWIGNWILHEACSQMRTWNLQYPRNPAFTVAVNISARQFAQMDLANQITQMLRDSGLAATDLKLEVTESVIMSDGERTARVLSELKTLGVRLCIDDFGTGYSSLSYLRRFVVDTLKIDRSFVSEMLNNRESREIVKAVTSLGTNLGIEVVAEGVETREQVSLLRSIGCKYAQGYFFSRPLDPAEIVRSLLATESNSCTLPQESPSQLVGPAN